MQASFQISASEAQKQPGPPKSSMMDVVRLFLQKFRPDGGLEAGAVLSYRDLQLLATLADPVVWQSAWYDHVFGQSRHAFWKLVFPAQVLRACFMGLVGTFRAASWPLDMDLARHVAMAHAVQVFVFVMAAGVDLTQSTGSTS